MSRDMNDEVDDKVDEYTHAELIDECEHAKDGLVISIRSQWEGTRSISDKQARVLARWLVEQERSGY